MRDASRQFVARFDSRALPEAPEVWRALVRPYVDVCTTAGSGSAPGR